MDESIVKNMKGTSQLKIGNQSKMFRCFDNDAGMLSNDNVSGNISLGCKVSNEDRFSEGVWKEAYWDNSLHGTSRTPHAMSL